MDQNDESPKVVFEDEQLQQPVHSSQAQTPGIIQWVVSHSGGLVKNEKQANYILIIFIILMVFISLFLLFGKNGNNLTPEEQQFVNTPQGQFNP